MNFLEYVNKDSEGLVFIDKIRNVIKELCNKGIREEFQYVTEDDINKLTLMLECNFFSGITAEDSEWDLNTITIVLPYLEDLAYAPAGTEEADLYWKIQDDIDEICKPYGLYLEFGFGYTIELFPLN